MPLPSETLNRSRLFWSACALLACIFAVPLFRVARFALQANLYSHTILIPAVSAYLIWIQRDRLATTGSALRRGWGVAVALLGVGLAAYYLMLPTGSAAERQTALAVAIYSLVSLIGAAALLLLVRENLRIVAFPLIFLIFLAPFPMPVEDALEGFLQRYSALTAHWFFQIAGMPAYREGTYFRLPGFSMFVAPECSGIHSTVALFLTSLVGGQLLLRSPWRRTVLALVVIPIALVRNGFRVFVIGELCVRIGPEMIDSFIHTHGGPIFFTLSLIPFSLVLFWLIKSDRRALPDPVSPSSK